MLSKFNEIVAGPNGVFVIVWLLAVLAAAGWWYIQAFRSSVVLALLSIVLPIFNLLLIFLHWEKMKNVAIANLALGAIGFFLMIVTDPDPAGLSNEEGLQAEIRRLQEEHGMSEDDFVDEKVPTKKPSLPVNHTTTNANEQPLSPFLPDGWQRLTWQLPDLYYAGGNPSRGEFATIHIVPCKSVTSFDAFNEQARKQTHAYLIQANPARTPHTSRLAGKRLLKSYSLAGRCRLEGMEGQPMAARLNCLEGTTHFIALFQWRNQAWDQQTTTNFNRMTRSLAHYAPPQPQRQTSGPPGPPPE